MTGWHPIETAPKDGTRILLVSTDRGSYEDEPYIAGWNHTSSGGLWIDDSGDIVFEAAQQPTHWMPLPEPPSSVNGASDD